MRRMSSQDPNLGSISRYVIGANPRSAEDGNGGRMWTPRNNPSSSPSRSAARAESSPPSESGYVSSCGRGAISGDPIDPAAAPSGPDRASDSQCQLARAGIAVAAHLVAQVREPNARLHVGERQLPARTGVPEARWPEHRLGGRRGELEARPPASAVVRHARQLRTGRLDAEKVVPRLDRQERPAIPPGDAAGVETSEGFGGADAVRGGDLRCLEIGSVER